MEIRDYQKEAIETSVKSNRGIICLPTGSGKTLVQSQVILRDYINNKGHKIYLVLSPRIVLSYQLMKEYFITFNEAKEKFWYAGLHSGNKVDIKEFEEARDGDIDFQDIVVTTSSSEIRNEIEKARIQNLPIIIFGTYHSADRCHLFMNGSEFDTVICDEAHYLVSSQFENLVREVEGIKSKRTLFFTATLMKTASNLGKGMNNEQRFGQVIYQKTPRWMIDNGYMVRPRMHIIRFDREIDGSELITNSGRIISECLHQHEYVTRRNAKIFVTCTGTPMMQEILRSREISDIRRRKGISIYAVASDPEIGNQIDGVGYSRQEFLSRLRRDGLDPNKGMLIIHIDILSEGIDVPGITGILPFRSLKKSKFIQTLGRASRITKEDYESFTKGEYGHQDLDAMLKPYAWVMIPDIEGEDTSEEIMTMIRDLRDYGFEPSEDIYISNEMGKMPPVSLMDPLVKPDVRNPALNAALEEIFHEFESEAIAKLLEGKTIEELIEISCMDNPVEHFGTRSEGCVSEAGKKVIDIMEETSETSGDLQINHTPPEICKEMLDKVDLGKAKNVLVLFNIELLYELRLRGYAGEVYYFTQSPKEVEFAKKLIPDVNLKYIEKEKDPFEFMNTWPEKFDVIVANPPYSKYLHLKFLDKCLDICKDRIVFVHPSNSFINTKGGNRVYEDFNRKNEKFIESVELFNGNPIFSINLKTPCSITVVNPNKNDTSIFVSNIITNESYISNGINGITQFPNHRELWSIKEKVDNYISKNGSLDEILCDKMKGDYMVEFSRIRGNHNSTGDKSTPIYKDDFFTFVDRKLVVQKKNESRYDLWFKFQSELEAQNFLDYLKSDFARYCLAMYKFAQSLNNGELRFIPLLDFKQKWDNKKLYDYFNINQDEIDYIKKIIPKYY